MIEYSALERLLKRIVCFHSDVDFGMTTHVVGHNVVGLVAERAHDGGGVEAGEQVVL